MRITDSELLDLLDEITSTLGELFLNHRKLSESILDQQRTAKMQDKIDALKNDVMREKDKLRKERDRQRRVKELEKISRGHDSQVKAEHKTPPRLVPVTDKRGKVVGWVQATGNDRIDVLDAKGRVVARQIGNRTLDGRGGFLGAGKQAMRALGVDGMCKKQRNYRNETTV